MMTPTTQIVTAIKIVVCLDILGDNGRMMALYLEMGREKWKLVTGVLMCRKENSPSYISTSVGTTRGQEIIRVVNCL